MQAIKQSEQTPFGKQLKKGKQKTTQFACLKKRTEGRKTMKTPFAKSSEHKAQNNKGNKEQTESENK